MRIGVVRFLLCNVGESIVLRLTRKRSKFQVFWPCSFKQITLNSLFMFAFPATYLDKWSFGRNAMNGRCSSMTLLDSDYFCVGVDEWTRGSDVI